jgi:alcohol dehydrogenase
MTGRAMLFRGVDQPLELVRAEVPQPRGAEMRVRTLCCTLCRSDLHTHAGRRQEPTPTVLGHEIVGCLDAFGPDAPRVDWRGQTLALGARVTWAVATSCGKCFFCAADLPQKCERLYKYGHQRVTPDQPFAGGLADFVLLAPGTACLRLPDSLSDELAAPANCATATIAAALRLGGVDPVAKTVLIFGAGVLGLTTAAVARSAGAAAVLVCDPDPGCRARAAAFGATHLLAPDDLDAVRACTEGRGADLVLELAGVHASVQAALEHARVGGTVVLAGTVLPTPAVSLDPERVVRRMLTIRGVHNYAPVDLAAAVDFLAGPATAFPFASLLGPTFELADAEAAFAHAHANPGTRVIVKPWRADT